MNRLRLLLIPVVAIAFALTAHAASKQKPTRPGNDTICRYKGYIVLDAATGNTLLEDNPDIVNPPASMTKLMTFAVISDKLQRGELTLETPIHIDKSDADMGGTEVWLDPRETFTVEELIYAMMIQSANDAAHALARASAGSVPVFIEQMNAKAKEIGMMHTIFRTPHGLTSKRQSINEGDLTTPHDFALLCRYAVLKTNVLKYSSIRERDFAPNRVKGPIHMVNHNKLIGRVIGVDGLKTGYTENAGYCLSATAERNGRRIVAVIMGCFGPNGEIDKGVSRDRKMIELLERGFAGLQAGPTPAVASTTPKPPAYVPTPAPKPAATARIPLRMKNPRQPLRSRRLLCLSPLPRPCPRFQPRAPMRPRWSSRRQIPYRPSPTPRRKAPPPA